MYKELFDEEHYKAEAKEHNEFANSILGIIAFTLALACLSFEHPQRVAILCLGIILPIYWQVLHKFPPTLYALRDLAKETKDPQVIEAVSYLENEYHGFKSMCKDYLVLLSGLGFYSCILIFPEQLMWFKI